MPPFSIDFSLEYLYHPLVIEMQKQGTNPPYGHGIDSTGLKNELSAIGFEQMQIDRFYDVEKENESHEASRYALSARKLLK